MSVFRFIAAEKADRSISLMCRVLGVSRSGFHAWERRPPSDRALADAWLSDRIAGIHRESRGTYGARRVHVTLRQQGVRVGRKRVERLMRALGLSGAVPRTRARTTIRVPGIRAAADLVGRDFVPARPNQLWVADIKYIPTAAGWLYLAAVLDCFSRRVVGWSMREDLRAERLPRSRGRCAGCARGRRRSRDRSRRGDRGPATPRRKRTRPALPARWLSPRTTSLYHATQAWAFVIGWWLVRGVACFILLGTLGLGYSFPLALLFSAPAPQPQRYRSGQPAQPPRQAPELAALAAPGIGTSQALAASVSVGALGVFSGAAVLLFAVAWRTGRLLLPARPAA